MLKSFLKKVFSSYEEIATTTEQRIEYQNEVQETSNPSIDLAKGINEDGNVETLTLCKEWLDLHSYREINLMVTSLYKRAEQSIETDPIRLRVQLDESLQDIDILTSKRISKYLSIAEHDIVDLTYFFDKNDIGTMEIYREFLVPKGMDELNTFLQERCLMIYETSVGLNRDYKPEIEQFLQALEITVTPSFFEEFDSWREEVLRKHEEEQTQQDERLVTSQGSIMIKISKEEVENGNIGQIDQYIHHALQSPDKARDFKGTLLFSFYGFSKHEDLLELMNRKEVNDWASLLVEKHPYIFYFLNDEDYPMTQFFTSLVVTTEVEEGSVYYNDEELIAFKEYVVEALEKLADWVQEDKKRIVNRFTSFFQ